MYSSCSKPLRRPWAVGVSEGVICWKLAGDSRAGKGHFWRYLTEEAQNRMKPCVIR